MSITTYKGKGSSLEKATELLYREAGRDIENVRGQVLYSVTLQGPKGKTYSGVQSTDYGIAFLSALEAGRIKTKTYLAHPERYSLEVLAVAEVKDQEETVAKGKPSGAERKLPRTGQLTDKF